MESVTAGSLVWRLTLKWRAAAERALVPLGLTHAQYVVLASLRGLSRRGARPSQRELADYTGLEQVFVSKLVRALERSGFVGRETHPDDTRAVQLRLTERGVDVIDRAVAVVHEVQEGLAEPLGGTAGGRYRELIDMLRTLLGAPRRGGDQIMTQVNTLFGQDLGVAHRAGNRLLTAILDRDALSFPEWVTMKIVHDTGAPIPGEKLAARVADGVGASVASTAELLTGLQTRGILHETPGGLDLTGDGRTLFTRLFTAVQEFSAGILDGLPPEDVETTRRILAEYTERATGLTKRLNP